MRDRQRRHASIEEPSTDDCGVCRPLCRSDTENKAYEIAQAGGERASRNTDKQIQMCAFQAWLENIFGFTFAQKLSLPTSNICMGEKKKQFLPYPFNLNDVAMLSTSAAKRLSVLRRASTCAQLCNTVLWSRPPTSFPMRLAGILVYF